MTVAETAEPPTPAGGEVGPAVRAVVAVLVAGSALALVGVAAAVPAAWPGWERFAIITALVAVSHADGAYIYRGSGRIRFTFNFAEIGLLIALVALPGVVAPLAVVVGTAALEVTVRRQPAKAAFNIAQHALGACAASLTLAALPPLGSVVFGVSLVTASVAVVVHILTTLSVWLLLLLVVSGRSILSELRLSLGLDAVTALATTSVGVVGVYLWAHDLVLLVYSVVPLAAILLAYRYLRISRELEIRRSADAEGLRRLVSSTTDGILMVDESDLVRVWNPVLEDLTGIPAAQVEGRPLGTVMDAVGRVADGSLGSEAEVIAIWQSGHVMEERTSRVRNDEGTGAGKVIVLRDVTRQQEADALKSDFVARVSHELRTPLTPLIGFVELLRTRGDRFAPAAQAEALESMNRNARRLSTLVDELLLVVELDGGLQHRAVAVELSPVTRAAVGRLRLDATDRRIDIDVPAGPVVTGDAERLTEVLAHLVDNAVRYSPEGSPVAVTTESEGETVVVRVADHGPGIPPTAHDAVFERFSRLEGPLQMRTSGLGLGLFIARRLAESMGGTLGIGSSGPEGTTMELRLPAVLPAPPRGSGPVAQPGGSGQREETGEDQTAAGRGQGVT